MMRKKRYQIILTTALVFGIVLSFGHPEVSSDSADAGATATFQLKESAVTGNTKVPASLTQASIEVQEIRENGANKLQKPTKLPEEALTSPQPEPPVTIVDPQPITPTVPPIVPEKPDVTLPPVTVEPPTPITPTVPPIIPVKPDITLPPVTIEIPTPLTPTAPPITPEKPDISLPPVSPLLPETAAPEKDRTGKKDDASLKEKKPSKAESASAVHQKVTGDNDIKLDKVSLPISNLSLFTDTVIDREEVPPTKLADGQLSVVADKEAARKHTIAVNAASAGGVVTGIGTSALLLSILKKVNWLRQFFGK